MPKRFAACIVSRQPKNPSAASSWIKDAKEALLYLKKNNRGLITSVGMQTWELLTTLGREHSLRMKILLPADSYAHFEQSVNETRYQFDLEKNTRFIFISPGETKKEHLKMRDQKAIQIADELIPLSIRSGGSLEKYLKTVAPERITDTFSSPYCSKNRRGVTHMYPFPEQLHCTTPGRYLFHWTRACDTAWRTERKIDYYRDILTSPSYPRSAFDTLKNILRCKTIISANRHMPHRQKCVCFTSRCPEEFISLMRWRKRYGQMSFEPYGIGVEKVCGEELGIKEVEYVSSPTKKIPREKRWHYQSIGKKGYWPVEKEYRHAEDFPLTDIPGDKLLCCCYSQKHAEEIEQAFGIRSIFFTK